MDCWLGDGVERCSRKRIVLGMLDDISTKLLVGKVIIGLELWENQHIYDVFESTKRKIEEIDGDLPFGLYLKVIKVIGDNSESVDVARLVKDLL